MFGQNPVSKKIPGPGHTLWVQEIFRTIQGEGPYAGVPAIFIRLAGCNLRCWFCDTDFSSSTWKPSVDEVLEQVHDKRVKETLCVITGGEPLLQNIAPLCELLLRNGFTKIQVETAGTVWHDGIPTPPPFDIVCSPKTGVVHRNVREWCRDYKYIVRADTCNGFTGLPTESTQERGKLAEPFAPPVYAATWLQPCEEHGEDCEARTRANIAAARDACMMHGHRLSLQLHKLIGLP